MTLTRPKRKKLIKLAIILVWVGLLWNIAEALATLVATYKIGSPRRNWFQHTLWLVLGRSYVSTTTRTISY